MLAPDTRRLNTYTDERGVQYDEDLFTYSFVPGAPTPNSSVSGTLAPNASAIATVNIQQDSAFEVIAFTANCSNNGSDAAFGPGGNILIQITDTAAGRNLFNEPIPMGLVAGSGKFSYVLPTPRRFMPRGSVNMTFQNIDTAVTYKNIQFDMIGRKIYPTPGAPPLQRFRSWKDPVSGLVLSEDFFVYHIGYPALNAGADITQQVLIESDSNFEARTISAQCNATLSSGQATDMIGQAAFSIKDGGTSRDLNSTAINAPSLFGNNGVPMILPIPRIFMARTNIFGHLYNQSAATNLARADVVFAGRKIFQYGRE